MIDDGDRRGEEGRKRDLALARDRVLDLTHAGHAHPNHSIDCEVSPCREVVEMYKLAVGEKEVLRWGY